MERSNRTWWGEYELGHGQSGRWRIGPLQLHIRRSKSEWRVAWSSPGSPKDEATEVEVPTQAELPHAAQVNRYTQKATASKLTLSAALADRPVVVKPETPLFVPGGEETTLFVGSPVWVRILVGDPPVQLAEIPSHRATDTWAGPNTREGQVCYGSRTLAQLDLADCTIRPHRAITAVQVRNRAPDPLLIEQIQLPAPLLALYATTSGMLWTQSVTLVREPAQAGARIEIGAADPPDGGVLRQLSEPRARHHGNAVFQVFNRLFG